MRWYDVPGREGRKNIRVLVTGGRDYNNAQLVGDVLWRLAVVYGRLTIIHGNARGLDTLAAKWAEKMCQLVLAFPADWAKHGKAAGPIRNQQMLTEGKPDLVVAFPGGKGTADMVARTRKAGIPLLQF